MNKGRLFRINTPDVIHEIIDDEAVIVNMQNGHYYSLRDAGVEIWDLISDGVTSSGIHAHILGRYYGDHGLISDAISALLQQLEEENLIIGEAGGSGESAHPVDDTGAEREFTPLVLEKFTDMEELLVLDPIHAVADEGWPHAAPDGQDDES